MSTSAKYNRVMIVDDNELDNFINKKLIESEDFSSEVIDFTSAGDALAYLNKCTTDISLLPHIIFLDIIMPVMDGFAFLEEFDKLNEEIKKKCKIIMLSTTESFTELNRANQNKYVRKFLNKPLSSAMLKAINFA